MKNLTKLALVLVVFSCSMLRAQDMIVKKDGSIVKAKITEVGEETVKYKKAENPDGPVYSISKESITSINYASGEVEKFDKKAEKKAESSEFEGEEKPKPNALLEDETMKRTLEGISKDVGEQLMRNCANGKVDNSTTEIYWDGVYKDAVTGEINLPIITSWKPKWNEGNGKWVKGKILIMADGSKKWVYQNDSGLLFSSCAKGFRIK